jgi:hypothetical protein
MFALKEVGLRMLPSTLSTWREVEQQSSPGVLSRPVKDHEFVISDGEKTRLQARRRRHAAQNCRPRTPMRVEREYSRYRARTYIAALDVHRALVFGRCDTQNGIAPFDRLVEKLRF